MTTTFLRLLAHDDKPAALAAAVAALRAGEACPDAFATDPASFQQVPGSPFAYWVSNTTLSIFTKLSFFENQERKGRQGGVTGDDFRYIRLHTEVLAVDSISQEKGWVPFAKGGEFRRYWLDLPLVVWWDFDRGTFYGFTGLPHRPSERPASSGFYFRPGVTWSLRSQAGLSVRVLPANCAFSHKGPSAFVNDNSALALLGVMNCHAFQFLVSLQMAFGSYEVGVIQRTPVPYLDNPQGARLSELALACVDLKRDLDRSNETSHVFHLPALLQVASDSLAERAAAWAARVADAEAQLAAHQGEIDEIAFALYGIDGADRAAITGESGVGGQESEEGDVEGQAGAEDSEDAEEAGAAAGDLPGLTAALVSYLVGCACGRFDIRYATGALPTPTLPDPFAPLPACSPGMLTGDDGLPLRATPQGYPLPIDGDGILVDDPDHPDDIVGRVRAALEQVFGARAEAVEREACAALGVAELRDYLRRPGAGGFWADHIRRYSKSRRKAPIYWLLQSPRRSYALWLYLHRLDGDTLSKALVSYVEPKLRMEQERLARLQATKGGLTGRDLRQAERDIERQEATIADIRELRDRLERAVRLNLTPDLNDGVVLTIAPLHELVPWKEARQYWDELLAGTYEWSSIDKQIRERGLVR